MRKLIASIAVMAMIGLCGALTAQSSTPQPDLTSPDANTPKTHDRSSGMARMRLPSPASTPGNPPEPSPPPPEYQPVPPSEGEDIPPSETPPDPPPPEDPPTYYGEPVQGKFAFSIDASGSMHGNRIATVRAETVSVISELTESDEFDVSSYGSQFPASQHFSKFMWGALLPATEGNKASAISWVNGPSTNPGGMTPSYPNLKRMCEIYPADLTKMFFLTDGYPNWPSGTGSAANILADFPGWFSKFEDCHFIAICIGGVGSAQQFMQQLAAIAGGTYISA
jgi:hypothetical protein